MTPRSLVVGAGGLLGSAVVRRLTAEGHDTLLATGVPWNSAGAGAVLAARIRDLVSTGQDWRVVWCAGAGVTDTAPAELDRELATFQEVLDAVAALNEPSRARGSFVYASSAGGVYGGSMHPPYTEETPPVPLGSYGRAKLDAEAAVTALAVRSGVRVLVARIANIYGPGQNLSKPQGLISRLCASAVTRQPLSVYVSLDTLRDYVFVDDCADRIIAASDRLTQEAPGACVVKIVGSGRSTSIAALVREFERVLRSRPLLVMGSSSASHLQGRDLRLRSQVWTDLDDGPATTLPEGIHRTLEHVRGQILSSGVR
jgi:UDP-glucose 4-epimerase